VYLCQLPLQPFSHNILYCNTFIHFMKHVEKQTRTNLQQFQSFQTLNTSVWKWLKAWELSTIFSTI
jgi:hypothetical protein